MMPKPQTVILLHVAKTGGTYLKEVIRANCTRSKGDFAHVDNLRVILPGHVSLAKLAQKYGADTPYGFVFRDPCARFVSGFYSRLRMGRPTRAVIWDNAEAAAFAHFDRANDLAEALSSGDERQKSAAIFSMTAIRHLRRGYEFHFGPPLDFALAVPDRLKACVDVANLDARIGPFLGLMGLPEIDKPAARARPAPLTHDRALSDLAQKNLREFWAVEFEYFDMFKQLEQGFFTP